MSQRDDDAAAREAAAMTLAEYDSMAEAYRHGTADHDVSQNIAALLDAIEGDPPYGILDLGCGPGRDLRAFTALGHEATGLDGAAELVALARAETRLPRAAPGFPRPRPAGRALRRGLRQRLALSRAEQPDRAGAGRACREPQAARRALLLEPQGRQPGRLGRRPLRLLLGPRDLARPRHRRGLSRASPLLPPARPPPSPAALARHRLAKKSGARATPGNDAHDPNRCSRAPDHGPCGRRGRAAQNRGNVLCDPPAKSALRTSGPSTRVHGSFLQIFI